MLVSQSFRHKEDLRDSLLDKGTEKMKIYGGCREPSPGEGGISFAGTS